MFLAKHFISLEVHLGHRVNKWNARNAMYLLVERSSVHIIDLEQTIPMLRRALSLVSRAAAYGGKVCFAMNSQPAQGSKGEAKRDVAGRCAVSKWGRDTVQRGE